MAQSKQIEELGNTVDMAGKFWITTPRVSFEKKKYALISYFCNTLIQFKRNERDFSQSDRCNWIARRAPVNPICRVCSLSSPVNKKKMKYTKELQCAL